MLLDEIENGWNRNVRITSAVISDVRMARVRTAPPCAYHLLGLKRFAKGTTRAAHKTIDATFEKLAAWLRSTLGSAGKPT